MTEVRDMRKTEMADELNGCGAAWIEYSTADNCAALRQSDPAGNDLMLAFEAGWKAGRRAPGSSR